MNYRQWHTSKTEKRKLLEDELEKSASALSETMEGRRNTERARDVMNTVLMLTQQKVKDYIEEIVSLALSSVYGESYAFRLDISVKRNQSEAVPQIIEDGIPYLPRDDSGGGVVDVASIGLRFALWALERPRKAKIFLLDEPAKFTGSLLGRFAEMLKEISRLMGIQIIMVSHDSSLSEVADKTYTVRKEKGVSHVYEEK